MVDRVQSATGLASWRLGAHPGVGEVGNVAWLMFWVALSAAVTAGLLGHLGPVGEVVHRLWRRVRPLPPRTDRECVEQLAADLRRLADGLERAHRLDQPAKWERLTAASLAYDWVLLSAARTLEVPAPESAPLDAIDRLQTEAALAARGLDW